MEKDTFDYNSVPFMFTHCFRDLCPRRGDCLRYLAGVHCTEKPYHICTVNPRRIPENPEDCPYFRSTEKVSIAWGVKKLLLNVPLQKSRVMKKQMLAHFGRNTYYRFYRRELPVSPAEQEYVRQLFRRHGVTEEPEFDEYTETYNWRD